MVLLDNDPGTEVDRTEIIEILTPSGVIFGNDSTSHQVLNMGNFSGAPFTEQLQLDRYRELRLNPAVRDSDQVVYSRVLRQTGGAVDVFEKTYPNIFRQS